VAAAGALLGRLLLRPLGALAGQELRDRLVELGLVVAQVGQVVGEIREVVAGTDLQVLAQRAIDREHGAAAPLASNDSRLTPPTS